MWGRGFVACKLTHILEYEVDILVVVGPDDVQEFYNIVMVTKLLKWGRRCHATETVSLAQCHATVRPSI